MEKCYKRDTGVGLNSGCGYGSWDSPGKLARLAGAGLQFWVVEQRRRGPYCRQTQVNFVRTGGLGMRIEGRRARRSRGDGSLLADGRPSP